MRPTVLTLNIQMKTHDAQVEESLWDSLVLWCDARQLFLGGRPENAVIYAPILPISQTQIRQLSHLLNVSPDVDAHRLEFVDAYSLYHLALKAAAVEAFSQAQQFLAERLANGADALAGLTYTLNNRWSASVTRQGTQLELRNLPSQLRVSVSRFEGIPLPDFERYAGQSFSLQRMEDLIPNWLGLHWSQLEPRSDLQEGEWMATYQNWRVNLYADPSSGLDHREVMLRYLQVCG